MTLEPAAASAKARQIAESLLAVIESAVPESRRASFQGSIQTAEPAELAALTWTRHLCSSDPGSEFYLGSSEADLPLFAKLFDLGESPEGHREPLLKMMRQWFVQVFDAVGDSLPDADWTPGPSAWAASPPSFNTSFKIEIKAGRDRFVLGVGFSSELVQHLQRSADPRPAALIAPDAVPVESGVASSAKSSASMEPLPTESLGLLYTLLDIELPVSILFGRTQVSLGELVKYGPGTVVELDRSVSDPVEIRINDHVVARGEVVAIDGNYGVRIEEVISAQDRIKMTAGIREKKDPVAVESL